MNIYKKEPKYFADGFMIDWRGIHDLQYIMANELPSCHETQEDKITYKMGILGVFKLRTPQTQAKPSFYKLITYVRRVTILLPPNKTRWLTNRKLQSMNFCIIHLNFFEYQLDFHFSTPQNASSEFIERRPENETQGKCSRNAVNTGWTAQTTHKSPDIFSYSKPTL